MKHHLVKVWIFLIAQGVKTVTICSAFRVWTPPQLFSDIHWHEDEVQNLDKHSWKTMAKKAQRRFTSSAECRLLQPKRIIFDVTWPETTIFKFVKSRVEFSYSPSWQSCLQLYHWLLVTTRNRLNKWRLHKFWKMHGLVLKGAVLQSNLFILS